MVVFYKWTKYINRIVCKRNVALYFIYFPFCSVNKPRLSNTFISDILVLALYMIRDV